MASDIAAPAAPLAPETPVAVPPRTSPRRAELLDRAYDYVLDHGLAGLSLRPLAAATGTSPRVLLYLFGSKDGLVRELLARGRQEQVAQMTAVFDSGLPPSVGDAAVSVLADRLWSFLSAPERRASVRLTYEAFLASVGHEPGPWQGFAAEQLRDWLDLLCRAQPDTPPALALARATRALALVRGLLLDLLACEEPDRVASALELR
jgi:AcrR family transcriptional regulator